jgi:hypothetical protein
MNELLQPLQRAGRRAGLARVDVKLEHDVVQFAPQVLESFVTISDVRLVLRGNSRLVNVGLWLPAGHSFAPVQAALARFTCAA